MNQASGAPAVVSRATRVGMLIGACAALLWTNEMLSFARRPMETDEPGLYGLFATIACVFCLIMFPVVVTAGGLIGWVSGIALTRIRDRRDSRRVE